MPAASDLADWWDKKTKESDQALLEFVDANPKYWVIAAVAQTGMEFAGAMVFDVLRFGEGAAESCETGRIAPLVQDVFRGMALVGPAGAVASRTARAGVVAVRTAGRVQIYAKVPGKVCAPIAIANAVRRTGQRLFVSLAEIARAHGLSLDVLSDVGVNMSKSIAALRQLRITFVELGKAVSWESLVARFAESDGVVMVRLISSNGKKFHRVILEKVGGVVRIVDRYGIFMDLKHLSARYPNALEKGEWLIDCGAPAVLIKRVVVNWVSGQPLLMIVANAIVHLGEGTSLPELDAKFEQFKAQRGGSSVIHLTPPPTAVVVRGDTLSGLSAKHYGTVEYWPLIWDANKETVGANPNRIVPGMTLKIPPLSAFGEKEKADARRRHPTWRNYG